MTKAFGCYNKNEEIRMKSSSGGFYYLVAKRIVSSGGVVYGACYEGTNVCHRRIDTVDGILVSCGSKYQPSKLGDTFKQVKADLNVGKTVLFTGTPCQCRGLLSLVGESENLYCSDFVCHGIPSKVAWREYLSSMKKRGTEVTSVNMRDKVSGWSGYSWRLTGSDGKEIIEHNNKNVFMKGFIAGIYLRPSCYECCFKGIERKTDFTLGDYWGVQNIQPELFDNKGISLVLVHSDKGIELFDEISGQLEYAEANLDRAVQANPSVVRSSQKPSNRAVFMEGIGRDIDFIQLVNNITKIPLYKRAKRKGKSMIKQILGGG